MTKETIFWGFIIIAAVFLLVYFQPKKIFIREAEQAPGTKKAGGSRSMEV